MYKIFKNNKMTSTQKDLIKATIPILKSNGEDLVKYFYNRMFIHNPELKNLFNMGNQSSGKQQSALTGAVLAYAENIDNPTVLINTLKLIGNKHVSLQVTAKQYDIVGNHLIASIKEVLGAETATEELLHAWTIAYTQLAQIMIDIEEGMYKENIEKEGGWNGWRDFKISKIVTESTEIKSFYLEPTNGEKLPSFKPGQYLSIKTYIDALGHEQPRQYSLSSANSDKWYRISIKKEMGNQNKPNGIFSHAMHDKKTGDIIQVSAPSGVFYIDNENKNPLVLISGGVGITPLMSMLEANTHELKQHKTVWIHSCRNKEVHAFKEDIKKLEQANQWLTTHLYYETNTSGEHDAKLGRINIPELQKEILVNDAKYYICGPELFIKAQYTALLEIGVKEEFISFEEFGPQLLNLN